MIEQDIKNKGMKSLCLHDEIYHIWLSMNGNNVMDINVSDNLANVFYSAGEFNGLKYTIKNERIFNDVFVRAMKQKPTLVKIMFQYYNQQTAHPDAVKDLKIKFSCFKRRVSIYVHKKAKKTKQLLWD